mmetsp:Transcript_11779/g.18266  ORF Transcript_11779/g.18266 Transcript_11779/m.18266 type:complete len:208 (+) Transcript_11779:337-960(+)
MVGIPGDITGKSSSRGVTEICSAVGFAVKDSRTIRSVAMVRCSVYPPTKLTTTSAFFNVSSCHPIQSQPTISSKSPPSQSRKLTLGCFLRNDSPTYPKTSVTRDGADAKKALRVRIVTSCDGESLDATRVPNFPDPPGITMFKVHAVGKQANASRRKQCNEVFLVMVKCSFSLLLPAGGVGMRWLCRKQKILIKRQNTFFRLFFNFL